MKMNFCDRCKFSELLSIPRIAVYTILCNNQDAFFSLNKSDQPIINSNGIKPIYATIVRNSLTNPSQCPFYKPKLGLWLWAKLTGQKHEPDINIKEKQYETSKE